MSNKKTKEHRSHQRYPMHWDVVVAFDEGVARPAFKGRTNDISIAGASILTDTNIYATNLVTLLLAIPPMNSGQGKTIVEIRGRMRYTVHSSEHCRFRIGFHFESFKGDGRAVLETSLARRAMGRSVQTES
ncbi:MAG: PilZ domain-containing protein [Sulfuritalea sp.]|nr:PilZ domain-containing protein [Sulfuritalea sp.]